MKVKTFYNPAFIDNRGFYWSSWIKKKYPKINPGAEIVIPEIPKNTKKGLTAAEALGLASSLVSVTFAIITLVNNLPK